MCSRPPMHWPPSEQPALTGEDRCEMVAARSLASQEANVAEQHCLRIALLGGTGAQGSALALRLARAGHQVTIGSRDAGRARLAAGKLAAQIGRASCRERVWLTVVA